MSEFSSERLATLLHELVHIAGGDLQRRIPVSHEHDELDAIAHAINVLVGELQIVGAGLRRAKEEAEAASRAKTAFLRNVSHELRTPLTVVLGMSDLISTSDFPRARVEQLRGRIFENGRALVTILDDLLDLSKIEAGRFDFDLQPVHVAKLAGEVVASFETVAVRRGLSLVLDSGAAEHARMMADTKRLRQILMNLVGNAIKFTERGRVAIRITCSGDTRQVRLDVVDTGIGMTPEQARVLFEPFMQADATISSRYGGSGLGLTISKRLAQGMAGTLDVAESRPGVGTTFRLVLPAATARVVSAPASIVLQAQPGLDSWRILVVDDHDDVRATTVELLRRAGAIASEAADGLEALDAVHRSAFDAILMDVRMPKLDGIEATRQLRANGFAMPIIAVTADAVPEQRAECLRSGCSGYLAKPLDLVHLVPLLGDRVTASGVPRDHADEESTPRTDRPRRRRS